MNPLKFYLICFILLLLVSCKEDNSISFPSEEKVTTLMNEVMEKSDLPAVVAIAINKNGEKASYNYGKAVWTEDAEVTPEHIFRLAYMTKLVTSIAALQCVENELVGLDDDLSVLMPEMTKIPILSNGKLIEPKNKITLRHLLSHSSGFGYIFTDEELANFDNSEWDYEDLPRRFESGTNFLYGTSTDWVGKLVEKLSNMNLEEYFKKNISSPLGMTRTFYNVPDSLHYLIVSRGDRGIDGNQKLTESSDRLPSTKVTNFNGGGGLFSTPSDYTKLLQCLLHEGKYEEGRILRKETIVEMTRNQIGDISLNPEGRFFYPGTCCNFNGLMHENSRWGLAFMIDNNSKVYGREAGTVMWGGYFNTYFYIDFKSGIAASIYTQHIPFNHFETTSLFERFSEIIYSQK